MLHEHSKDPPPPPPVNPGESKGNTLYHYAIQQDTLINQMNLMQGQRGRRWTNNKTTLCVCWAPSNKHGTLNRVVFSVALLLSKRFDF